MERPVLKGAALDELLLTPPSRYTMDLLRDWLANRLNGKAKYDPQAIFDVPPDFQNPPPGGKPEGDWDVRWAPNWPSVRSTTVGRFIASNLAFSHSRELRAGVEFLDKPWDDKAIKNLSQRVMDLRLDGRISHADMASFIDRLQWLGYAPTAFLTPSMTIDTVRLPKSTRKLKDEILRSERGDRVRAGDLKELGAVEKELIAHASKEREGIDPGFDIYASGARGSKGNNYKQVAVMRGAIRKSDDPSQLTISTATLEDGIPPDELPAYADLLVQASYGRAMMTAQGGYIAKQLNAAFQSLRLDPDPQSDCRTPLTLRVEIDDPREYLFRFYKEGGKLKEIRPDDLAALKGKTVEMRSPLFCGSKTGLCSRCAGTLHHRMGITNVGLVTSRIGSTLLNASLKAFHDTSLKLSRVNFGNYTREL